jgi:hypothetical protein
MFSISDINILFNFMMKWILCAGVSKVVGGVGQ